MASGHSGTVNGVMFSPDGSLLASASSDKTVRIWAIPGFKLKQVVPSPAGSVYSVAFHPNGHLLASGGDDKTVNFWDVESGNLSWSLQVSDKVNAIAFDAKGQFLVAGSNGNFVRAWELDSREMVLEIEAHSDWIRSVAFNPNSLSFASAGDDKSIGIWNAKNGELLLRLDGHKGWVRSIAFNTLGNLLLSGSDDKTVRLWNLDSGELAGVFEGHKKGVRAVAFSPLGKTFASGSQDGSIRIWDVDSKVMLLEINAHKGSVKSICYSPDGQLLASGGGRDIGLWDSETGKSVYLFKGDSETSSEGDFFASCFVVLFFGLSVLVAIILAKAWFSLAVKGFKKAYELLSTGSLDSSKNVASTSRLTSSMEASAGIPAGPAIEGPVIQEGEIPGAASIFISYSRRDREWLHRLRVHLRPLERENASLEIWDDSKILAGEQWSDAIERALSKADAAVLLVSADFLASDFIAENELPPLLSAAKKRGVAILPVILKPCMFANIESLAKFQSVNSPSEPLASLSENDQDRILVKVTERLRILADSKAKARGAIAGSEVRRSALRALETEIVVDTLTRIQKYDAYCEKITSAMGFILLLTMISVYLYSEEFFFALLAGIVVFFLCDVLILTPVRYLLAHRLQKDLKWFDSREAELSRLRFLLQTYDWRDEDFEKKVRDKLKVVE